MIIRKYGLVLKRLQKKDLELVRTKRNQRSVREHMFYQKTISKLDQEKWFDSINNIYNYYFLIQLKNENIGLINGKNIDYEKRESEGGIFIWKNSPEVSTAAVIASIIMAELTFKIFRFNTTYAFVKSSNVKQQIYNEKLGYQLINENKKEQKLTYALTSKNYKLKGTKILRAIGIVTRDHSEISWSDIDFSKVNPDTYTKQYTHLPSDIQTMIDQYILKFK